MATKKLSEIPVSSDFTDDDTIVGVRGGVIDYQYPKSIVSAAILASQSTTITAATINISNAGATLTNAFFATAIKKIYVGGGSVYVIGLDFTQDTGASTVTYTNGSVFVNGDTYLFER